MPIDCKVIYKNAMETSKDVSPELFNKTIGWALDRVRKFQDMAHKYPALRPIQAVLRNHENIVNKEINDTLHESSSFLSLPVEQVKSLSKLMYYGDRVGIRLNDEMLRKPISVDGEVIHLNEAQIEAYKSYAQSADYRFKRGVEAQIETQVNDTELAEHQRKLLDSFMDKVADARTKKEIETRISKDESLSLEDKAHMKELANSYVVGWMERSRGTGTHAIEVRDSTGRLIFMRKYNPLNIFEDKKALREFAISKAKEQLAINVKDNVAKLTYLKQRYEAKKLSLPEDKRDLTQAKIDVLEKRIAEQNARKILVDKSSVQGKSGIFMGEMAKNEYMTGIDLKTQLSLLDRQKQNSLSKQSKEIWAKEGMTQKEHDKLLKEAENNLDAVYGGMREDLVKAMKAQSHKEHSIHRAKEYIAGVDYENPQADLVHYIHQSAQSYANIVTSSHVFDVASKIEDFKTREIAVNKIKSVMKQSDDLEKGMNIISGYNFWTEFALNPSSGLVNVYGNPANFVSTLANMGVKGTEANGLFFKSMGNAGRLLKDYYLSKGTEFGDFINSYKFRNETEREVMKAAVSDGLTFDVVMKDFEDMNSITSKSGKLLKNASFMMTQTERWNRLASIMSAIRVLETNPEILDRMVKDGYVLDKGFNGEPLSHAQKVLQFADHFSAEVNVGYGKLNRSVMEEGRVGSVIRAAFPFQSYSVHQLDMYGRYFKASYDKIMNTYDVKSSEKNLALLQEKLNKAEITEDEFTNAKNAHTELVLKNQQATNGFKAFLYMNGYLGLTGGAGAVPLLTAAGYVQGLFNDGEPNAIEVAKMKHDIVNNMLGYGVAGMMGLDLTGSLQSQVPYVGSFVMNRWNQSDTMEQFDRGEYLRGIADNIFVPVFMKSIDKAIDDYDIKTKNGATEVVNGKEVQRDNIDKLAKAFGLNTRGISEEKQVIYARKKLDKWVADYKTKLNSMYGKDNLSDERLQVFVEKLDGINRAYGTKYSYEPKKPDAKEYDLDIDDEE